MAGDDWLKEKALEKKRKAEAAREFEEAARREDEHRRAIFVSQIDKLWGELAGEVRRQVSLYNETAGAPELVAEEDADQISLRSSAGVVMLLLDREGESIREQSTNASGANVAGGRIGGGFTIHDGRLALADGPPEEMVRAALEQLFSFE